MVDDAERRLVTPTALRVAMLATGLTSVIGQVIFIREAGAVFYGNELVLGIILTVWLLWVAAGAWLPGRLIDRPSWTQSSLAVMLAAAGLLPAAQIALLRGARDWLGVTPGAMIDLGGIALIVTFVLAPLCFALGACFRLGARLLVADGDSAGTAYVWEAAGAALGGILFAFVLVRWANPFGVSLGLAAAAWWAAALLWGDRSRPRRYAGGAVLLAGAIALFVLALWQSAAWNLATLRGQYPGLLYTTDTVYGRLAVTGNESQRVFYENGLVMFDTQSLNAELTTHPALLAHPDPRRLLLIGGGVGGDLREALKHPLDHVDYVELDPATIDAARRYLSPDDMRYLDDPRVTLVSADGREYLSQRVAELRDDPDNGPPPYDVILIDLPEPSTGQLNRFYTREFYELAHAALGENGIISFGLPAAENYLNPELRRLNASVRDTLATVFPHVVVLPGDRNIFLASAQPISDDPLLWIRRLEERHVDTRDVTPPYLRFLLATERYPELQTTLAATPGRVNLDFTPVCYYYDAALWMSRFSERVAATLFPPEEVQLWPFALPAALAFVVLRLRRAWRVTAAVALAGFAGMNAEVVLLLAFQALHGYVYYLLSLIVAAYMVGTAAGATLIARCSGRERRVLVAVLAALTGYSAVLPLVLRATAGIAPISVPLLALLGGGLAGAVFPPAVRLASGGAGGRAGAVYAADLLGGSLGALLGAVFWIPLLGISSTCALVALWVACAAIALL